MRMNSEDGRGKRGGGYEGRRGCGAKGKPRGEKVEMGRERKGAERGLTLA